MNGETYINDFFSRPSSTPQASPANMLIASQKNVPQGLIETVKRLESEFAADYMHRIRDKEVN